jgi:hypothetical protein
VWEAVDLCEQLLLDPSSHLCAAVAGWDYPAPRQEISLTALLARVVNATSGKGDKPYVPVWPWPAEPKAEAVTDEERAKLKARLKSKSAFGQKRTEA